jgi:uncharacterized protein YaiI (UPF0178 family)
MKIWIDADACPQMIKEVVFKVAVRLHISATLVANSGMFVPRSPLLRIDVVGGGVDEADRHIVAHSSSGDLVVTADIPLASALVEKGVVAIDPRGVVYSSSNVKEALATRDLMHDLRESGLAQGGPPPLGPKDRERFANALDRELTRLRRAAP